MVQEDEQIVIIKRHKSAYCAERPNTKKSIIKSYK